MFQDGSHMQKIGPKLLELFAGNENNPIKKTKKIIKMLKKNTVPTQILFADGNTLMHLAVQSDLPPLVEYLLAQNPELLNLRNNHGVSPIGLARINFNDTILNLFKQVIFPICTPPPANKDDIAQLNQQFSELKIFKKSDDIKPKRTQAFSEAKKLIENTHIIIDSLESDLEELLLHSGFEYQECDPVGWTENPVWDICASLRREDGKVERKPFDKKYTMEMVQAILSVKTAPEIIQDLIDLWVAFDKGQKLTAIFILKELIIRDPNHRLLIEDNEHLLANFIALIKSDFQNRSTIISRTLKNLLKTSQTLLSNPVYIKYRKRYHSALSVDRAAARASFERLVLETSELPLKKQRANIASIANEFDALSLSFIHNVELSEFYGCAWEKEQRDVTSPNIVRQTTALNQFSNFIQSFILQASNPQEFAARYSLFVQVAAHLAKPHDGMPPNFDAVIFIMCTINSFYIARAKSCLELLSAEDKKTIEQLKKISDPAGGFRAYRELVKASKFAIIHPPRVQANIVFASQNDDPNDKLEMLGATFLNFIEYQKKARAIPFHFKSDLLYLLSSEQYVTQDTHFICLSGQFAPIGLDGYTPEMLNDLLKSILKRKIIPNMRYDGIDYPPQGIIIPVVKKLKEIAESEVDSEEKKALLSKAKKIVINLTKLINQKYDLAQQPPKLSQLTPKKSNSTEIEHQPVMLLSKKLSDLKRNQSYNTITVPSQLRRKLSFS